MGVAEGWGYSHSSRKVAEGSETPESSGGVRMIKQDAIPTPNMPSLTFAQVKAYIDSKFEELYSKLPQIIEENMQVFQEEPEITEKEVEVPFFIERTRKRQGDKWVRWFMGGTEQPLKILSKEKMDELGLKYGQELDEE